MKSLFYSLIVLTSGGVFGQNTDAVQKIEATGVSISQIEHCLKDGDAKYYFKASETSISTAEAQEAFSSSREYEFDPQREVGNRWKLLKVNGETPDEDQTKSFNKSTNTTKKEVNGKIDQSTLQIVDETDEVLKFKFRFQKKSLPKKYKFMKDCEAVYTIDKNSNKLVSGRIENFKPTKVSIIKVPKLIMDMEFIYLDKEDGYHIISENMDMTIKFLGAEAQGQTIITFTGFEKVIN